MKAPARCAADGPQSVAAGILPAVEPGILPGGIRVGMPVAAVNIPMKPILVLALLGALLANEARGQSPVTVTIEPRETGARRGAPGRTSSD